MPRQNLLFAALIILSPPFAFPQETEVEDPPAAVAAEAEAEELDAPERGEEAAEEEVVEPPSTYAVITLEGTVLEVADPFATLMGTKFTTLRDVTGAIDRASADPDIAGLVIDFKGASYGLAQAEEIHRHLMEFRAQDKTVIAFQDNAFLADLIILGAADHVVMPPVGNVMVVGLQAQMYYMKDLLGKLGAEAQSIQTGRYKSALETLTHSSMSDDTRVQMTSLVEGLSDTIVTRFADARQIDKETAAEILWSGPYTSEQAFKAGLVTDLAYREAFMSTFADEHGITWEEDYLSKGRKKAEPINLFSLFSGVGSQRARRASARTQVALIYALGPIVDGVADSSPFGAGQTIASEDFLSLLDDIIADGPPRALVLRVDSPGGSAVASDRIWNRLGQIGEDYDIPVVVSMGGVAASGGYYISMGADRIFADETTITGSIGVIFGGLVLGETYSMIGVNKEAIGVGKHASILDETKRWNGEDLELLESMRDEVYDAFTKKAAEGRGMTHEAILEVAEGRVWTGNQALRIGLIDEIGGLENAIVSARRLAGLPENASVTTYPKEKTIFEVFDEIFAGNVSARPVISAWVGPVPGAWDQLSAVLPPNMVQNARNLMALVHHHPGQAMLMAPTMFEIK